MDAKNNNISEMSCNWQCFFNYLEECSGLPNTCALYENASLIQLQNMNCTCFEEVLGFVFFQF